MAPTQAALLFGPGLGDTQRGLLVALKRRGVAALAERGLVERRGTRRRGGRGRPEVVFGLAPAAEPLFLRREGELLRQLVRYLERRGQGALVDDFLRERVAAEREAALARVRGLAGEARLAAAA